VFHDAFVDDDSSDALAVARLFGVDVEGKVRGVGDEALFAGAHGVEDAFSGEGVFFDDVEGSSIEGEARGVVEPEGSEGAGKAGAFVPDGDFFGTDGGLNERHGHQQEGALKGYNPRRPGRLSHHPLLAVLAEAHFVMHGWLRSGNCGTARGVTEFLKEVLALWGERGPLRVVRADAGFFDKELFTFLEERRIDYIVVARFTKCVKREVTRIANWRPLDENYAVGECAIRLMGWDKARRFVAVRERVRDSGPSVGKKLIDLPEYTFRVLVTSLTAPTEQIWRDYNRRADMENRIAELKHDLGADRFCLRDFYATDAVFRSVLLLFNLLSEFRRASGMPQHKEPGTLRSEVFLCGAELTHVGSEIVLLLSTGWGGLKRRISLLSSILTWVYQISPKLVLVAPA